MATDKRTSPLSRRQTGRLSRIRSVEDAPTELEEMAYKMLVGCRDSAGVLSPEQMKRAGRVEKPVGQIGIRNAWHMRRVG